MSGGTHVSEIILDVEFFSTFEWYIASILNNIRSK